MRRIRRHDDAPRVEMMPMIDVIFLLLTFFIYAMIMLAPPPQILPVELTAVNTGEQAEAVEVQAITIDRGGQLYLNREPIAADALDERLRTLAEGGEKPKVFLAMEAEPSPEAEAATPVDRGPLLIGLIERVRQSGITDFHIVGTAGAE